MAYKKSHLVSKPSLMRSSWVKWPWTSTFWKMFCWPKNSNRLVRGHSQTALLVTTWHRQMQWCWHSRPTSMLPSLSYPIPWLTTKTNGTPFTSTACFKVVVGRLSRATRKKVYAHRSLGKTCLLSVNSSQQFGEEIKWQLPCLIFNSYFHNWKQTWLEISISSKNSAVPGTILERGRDKRSWDANKLIKALRCKQTYLEDK